MANQSSHYRSKPVHILPKSREITKKKKIKKIVKILKKLSKKKNHEFFGEIF